MVNYVKTTLLVLPELLEQLSEEAEQKFGTSRKVSQMLNEILAQHYSHKQDMFGISKPFDVPFVRDKKDRV